MGFFKDLLGLGPSKSKDTISHNYKSTAQQQTDMMNFLGKIHRGEIKNNRRSIMRANQENLMSQAIKAKRKKK